MSTGGVWGSGGVWPGELGPGGKAGCVGLVPDMLSGFIFPREDEQFEVISKWHQFGRCEGRRAMSQSGELKALGS